MQSARDVLARPVAYYAVLVVAIVAVLSVDSVATLPVQMLLGAVTWTILLLSASSLNGQERAQVAAVVVLATCGELLATQAWGRYEYRLHNLPLYVPAGHGMVYLGGLRLSQIAGINRHARIFRISVITALLTWVALGLTTLDRLDISGSISAVVLLGLLIWGKRPHFYSGVFIAVALLEIYGTQVGAWTWATNVPGLGITGGNPPSGGAATYVLCDIMAMACGPRVYAFVMRWWPRRSGAKQPAFSAGPTL